MAHPGPGGTDPVSDTPAERFADQLARTVDRLRSLSLARLGAPFEPEATRADAARATAQRLADVAAELESGPARTLPRLADAAVGDQVAVCGRDVLVAASATPESAPLLAALADDLLELRRRI